MRLVSWVAGAVVVVLLSVTWSGAVEASGGTDADAITAIKQAMRDIDKSLHEHKKAVYQDEEIKQMRKALDARIHEKMMANPEAAALQARKDALMNDLHNAYKARKSESVEPRKKDGEKKTDAAEHEKKHDKKP